MAQRMNKVNATTRKHASINCQKQKGFTNKGAAKHGLIPYFSK